MIRTIIVDDEPLALDVMGSLLRAHKDIDVLGSYRSGSKALEAIHNFGPDLVFLDIQMPGMSGFELISKLQPEDMPSVIFATAFDSFAVKAFDVHAVDYLLKPIDPARLAQSLQRVRQQPLREVASEQPGEDKKGLYLDMLAQMQGTASQLNREVSKTSPVDRLAIRDGSEVKLIPYADIDWIDAAGDYMCIHAGGQTHIMRCTMKELEERLSSGSFARIHRSTVVNLRKILSVTALPRGESELSLAEGIRLKVSRNYKAEIEKIKRA